MSVAPRRPGPALPTVLPGLLLLLLAAGPARGEDETAPARWRRLAAEAVERLHDLARACASARLYAARAEVYEDVLAFDPDDEVARKWLRYRRAKDGTWARPDKYVPPKDRSRRRETYEEGRAAWRAWFEPAATALLDAAADAGDVALRSRILAVAVRVLPDSEALRLENAETAVEADGKRVWILDETACARERRPELFAAVKQAVEDAPAPQTGDLRPEDDAGGVRFGRALVGPHVRVLGTPKAKEMDRQYRFDEACYTAFDRGLGPDPAAWSLIHAQVDGVTVWVFDDLEEGNAFLARQPGATEEFRRFAAPLAGMWVPGRKGILVKSPDPLVRLEAGPKQVLGMMSFTLFHFGEKRAWAGEGLSQYLAYLVTGTHLIASVAEDRSGYGTSDGETTPMPRQMGEDDWLRRGLELIAGGKKPNLYALVGKDINDLDVNDVLYAYCIVVYLVEGRPKRCTPFFRAVGEAGNADLDPLVETALGYDVPTLEARVRRWLEEMAATPR